jgi:hypothetical protein
LLNEISIVIHQPDDEVPINDYVGWDWTLVHVPDRGLKLAIAILQDRRRRYKEKIRRRREMGLAIDSDDECSD